MSGAGSVVFDADGLVLATPVRHTAARKATMSRRTRIRTRAHHISAEPAG
ncbi:hypothetical protein [Streptomyces sp. NPDC059564]